VDWATAVTGCPPILKKLLGSRVAHNCVKQSLTQGISGDNRRTHCAFSPKGVKCIIYSVVDKGTAHEKVVVASGNVKSEKTQGRPWRYLYAKLAVKNFKHHWTSAVVFQAITRAATATKYADVGWSMSTLEAVVSAPTVEQGTEDCCTNPRCDQRTQKREIEMNTIRTGI